MEVLYSNFPMLSRNRSTKSKKSWCCPIPACPCGYGRLCDLKNHFILRHSDRLDDFPTLKPAKVFQCGTCNLKFARQQVLNRHLLKIHNKSPSSAWDGEDYFVVEPMSDVADNSTEEDDSDKLESQEEQLPVKRDRKRRRSRTTSSDEECEELDVQPSRKKQRSVASPPPTPIDSDNETTRPKVVPVVTIPHCHTRTFSINFLVDAPAEDKEMSFDFMFPNTGFSQRSTSSFAWFSRKECPTENSNTIPIPSSYKSFSPYKKKINTF